ncbi:hypothetical protein SAMN05444411_103109 [Lutibacter oricola]|uniref:DUF5723 domain-containing protein n=1 Tax=Lutibacter oricola TaxID=762486 RepID=A0A1H2Z091_9FLAO|nr:DUF5723 family protein [Lutibacter oricola]SDX10761.1 hypothetical protein SAMN05444411_103109 [Lutibacter oricola]
MRKLALLSFLICFLSTAQNKQLLYGFDELPQTLLLNPGAEVSNKFHVGVPLLSGMHLNGGFSGFSAYDIFKDDGVAINTKIRNAIDGLGNTEVLNLNQQLEILSGGFKLRDNSYLSFGYYQELDMLLKVPKDPIELFYDGNKEIGRVYSFENLAARAEVLGVFHIGISKKINDKWTIGARAKLYSGVANARAKIKSGTFHTSYGTNNIYRHHLDFVNGYLQTSGIIMDDYDDVSSSFYTKKLLLGGNLGLGVDFGFTHHINKQWTVTGSALDIGFMNNSKETESYKLKGNYDIEGINLFFNEDAPEDYWDDLKDDFEERIVLDTIYKSYISMRPVKLNSSLSYAFGKPALDNCRFQTGPDVYTNKLGMQLYATIGTIHSQVAATLFYERRINRYLQSKVTYTVDSYSFKNLGVGVSTKLGSINSYFLVDNLLNLSNIYNAKSVSLQAGINYVFRNKN